MFTHLNGLLAQLVEQGTLNAWVGGSSPSQPTLLPPRVGGILDVSEFSVDSNTKRRLIGEEVLVAMKTLLCRNVFRPGLNSNNLVQHKLN